jgi:prevent-host-death family protein
MAVEGTVGAREFRTDLSEYLRRAHDGESFVVTRDGWPVAQLGPVAREEVGDD